MIQPYLVLVSAAGIAGILTRRYRLGHRERALQKSFEREQRKAAVAARAENPLRARITLEEKALQVQTNLAQVSSFLRRAETHFARGEWDETEKLLIQALALDEHNTKINRLLGLTYLHEGEWKKAELLFKKLVDVEPQEASHHGNLGLSLYHQNQLPPARAAYETALKLDDQKAARWVSLGQVCLQLTDYPAAIRAFRQAVDLEKKNTDYLTALAEAYELNSQQKAAVATYEKILEIAPYHEEIKARLLTIAGK